MNIDYTVKNKLCTGCGVCEDVCPKSAIAIRRIDGEHRPAVSEDLCLGEKCGKCLKVCPGIGINLKQKASIFFTDESVKEDKYIGRYVGLHTGYSLDEEVRYHSASGGLVTQFLIYLLENKIIDGAVVTGYKEDKITPYSYIAKTRDDVIKARSSKYCPVALNVVGNDIVRDEGKKFVIVGVPCHIQGFRKRASIDRRFNEKIIGYFALYCSSGRSFNAQDYIFKHYHVKKEDIRYFQFRDNGCLGSLTVELNGISKLKNLRVPYVKYYGPLLRSFFKPHRCLTCIDHYGELADICFGDIHIKPYSDDMIGISSWIVRSEYWENLFKKASEDGFIHMDDLNAHTLNESQKVMLYPKKRKAAAVARMDKLIGRQTPIYDKQLENPTLKDYISEIICHAQRFIGSHKSLWWIIEAINKGK